MKIYLASRFSRQLEMRERAKLLIRLGHTITSRWIDGKHSFDPDPGGVNPRLESMPIEAEPWAQEDWDDIEESDTMICFSERMSNTWGRGGRHVELGIALKAGKRIIVCGPRENVFHTLPQIEHYWTFAGVMLKLTQG